MSTPFLEQLREQIALGRASDAYLAEYYNCLFQHERAIAMVYSDVLDTLKKQDSPEEVKRILDWGELEIAKVRNRGHVSINKHMEEWEESRG